MSGVMTKQASMVGSLRNASAGPLAPVTSSVQTTVMSFHFRPAVLQHVVEHADVRAVALQGDLLALEVVERLEAWRGTTMWSPGRPGQLQEDDRLRVRVLVQHFRGLAELAHGAAQERRLAGQVVLDLGDEVVAVGQLELQPQLVE